MNSGRFPGHGRLVQTRNTTRGTMSSYSCGTRIIEYTDGGTTQVHQTRRCLEAAMQEYFLGHAELVAERDALLARLATAEAAERFAGDMLANPHASTRGPGFYWEAVAEKCGLLEPVKGCMWKLTPAGAALAARAKETR